MDFSNRTNQQSNVASSAQQPTVGNPISTNFKKMGSRVNNDQNKLFRIISSVLVLAVVILIIGLLAYLVYGKNNSNNETSYINTTKLQAVFLNTGQVYFGNLKTINNNYYILDNIFYLQTSNNGSSTASSSSSTAANTNVSLVKLGCELHAPYDQMVINSSSVTFWENLKPTGQVAKAVAAFEKANPNGQTCSTPSTTATNSGNTVNTTTPTANGSNSTVTTPTTTKP